LYSLVDSRSQPTPKQPIQCQWPT